LSVKRRGYRGVAVMRHGCSAMPIVFASTVVSPCQLYFFLLFSGLCVTFMG